jgi:hypothetical protein
MLALDGGRGREMDVTLSLEPAALTVRGRSGGDTLRMLNYRAITAATYVRSRRPSGQRIASAVEVPDNIGGSGFMGGARHWLTLQTATEFLVLRLEDRNVIRIMQSTEARTGLRVLRAQD